MEMSIYILFNNFEALCMCSLLKYIKIRHQKFRPHNYSTQPLREAWFLKWDISFSLVSSTNTFGPFSAKPTSCIIKANRCLSSQNFKKNSIFFGGSHLDSFPVLNDLTRATLMIVRAVTDNPHLWPTQSIRVQFVIINKILAYYYRMFGKDKN